MAETKKTSTKKKTTKRTPVKAVSAKSTSKSTSKKTSSSAASSKKSTKPTDKLSGISRFNIVISVLLLAQAVALVILGNGATKPINTNYLTDDILFSSGEGQTVLAPASRLLFDLNLAWLIAAFLGVSAVIYLSAVTWYRNKYSADLGQGISRLRWVNFMLSAGLMITAIGLLFGIYDISSLIMLFALNAIAGAAALKLEIQNQSDNNPNRLVKKIGMLAGILPWIIFGIYTWGAMVFGGGNLPNYVYAILVSILILFVGLGFATKNRLRGNGKWSDTLFTERTFLLLLFVAQSALAWQIYFGALK